MRVDLLLHRSARQWPDVVAVDDGTRRVTFAELSGRVRRRAGGLAAAGISPGDRVAVLGLNRVEYVEAYFALFELGAVCVPVNARLRAAEVEYQLEDAAAAAVVADAGGVALVEPLRARRAETLWMAFDAPATGWRAWSDLDGPAPPEPAGDPDAVVVQMYTSGTTGKPKGAMLTGRNVLAMVASWRLDMPLEPGADRFLQVTPLFHVGALLMMASTVSAGCALRLLPEFLPGPAVDVLETERITHALFVPAMVQWLLAEKGIEGRTFEALRTIVYGAAPMPVAVLERALAVFGCGFLQGYGLTETAGVLTTLRPEDHRWPPGTPAPERLASAGRPVLCADVRVVDPDGIPVEPGAVGEIVARGDNVSPGYWNAPGADAEAFRDGWFRTGDLARVDEAGYVYLVDRSKDMILVAGENVYPREVEVALLEHPGVRDCAVIGIPHEHWGEEVLAVVALEDGAAPSDRELVQHCRARLARFKCPTRVEVRDAVPRNAAGKILKRELRAPYWEGRARRV